MLFGLFQPAGIQLRRLRHSLYLHPALERLVMIECHNTAKSARLKQFKLKKDKWELLVQLEPILSVNSFVELFDIICIAYEASAALSQGDRMDVAIKDSPSLSSHPHY